MPQHEVYPLPRNAEEARRLNTQHQVWTKLVGYHIHPSIEANLPPNPHIADIGTGTAAFLIDMNNQHPSATLDGFDISDKLFPPYPRISNSIFTTCDDHFQKEYHNKYDLVHLRLLFTAIEPKDWPSTITNLAALLRPGGAIQWTEPAIQFTYITTRHDNITSPTHPTCEPVHMSKLADKFITFLGLRCTFATRLPELYKDAGLVNGVQDIVKTSRVPEVEKEPFETTLGAMIGVAKAGASISGASALEEVEELVRKVQEERDRGMMLYYDVHVTVAFKPE